MRGSNATGCDEPMPLSGPEDPDALVRALRDATLLRARSLLLRPPPATLAEDLRSIAEPLDTCARDLLMSIAKAVPPDLEQRYHAMLGPGGAVPACESDYEANPLGGKGQVLGDVCAFYRAFAFDPASEVHESPDHVAIELSFAAWLRMKEAYADYAGRHDDAQVCAGAYHTFRTQHLDRFWPSLRARLLEASQGGFYARVVEVL